MRDRSAARFRGAAVAGCSATVAVAAHGAAGGGPPSSATLTLLLVACGTVGALSTFDRGASGWMLLAWLTLAQGIGHLCLGLGHGVAQHAHSATVVWAMLLAHAAATALGAAMIELAERLWRVLSQVLLGLGLLGGRVALDRYCPALPPALLWIDLLCAGTGNRGPPAGLAPA